MRHPNKYKRKDALKKALGIGIYTDDLNRADCIRGLHIGAPVAKGILKEIIFNKNYDWTEITVISSKTLEDLKIDKAFPHDEPILVDKQINYYGQPILLLAHHDIKKLTEASKQITFDIEEQEAVFEVHIDNNYSNSETFGEKNITKGNMEKAFSEADYIYENIYSTQAQEHYYLETQIVVSEYHRETSTIKVSGSMQAPNNIKTALESALKKQVKNIIVEPITCGGAFGGREDYTTQLAIQASLIALISKAKVKMKLDRKNDMRLSTKRHPSSTKIRASIKGGKLTGLEINFLLNAGAYETISNIVLNRAMLHTSSFNVPNIRIMGKTIKTNLPPSGSFRGFGAPQMFFATQNHIFQMLKKHQIEEVKFLQNNLLKKNELGLAGQVISESIGLNELFERLLEMSSFDKLRSEVKEFNLVNKNKRRGLGLSNVYHGTGYTGLQDSDGEISLKLKIYKTGQVEILCSVIEFGQGSHTVLPAMASQFLDIPTEYIEVKNINTRETPNTGPTVASRTTSLVGTLLEQACTELKEALGDFHNIKQYQEYATKLAKTGDFEITKKYQASATREFNVKNLQGEAYENYAQASALALVEIDLITCNVKVISIFGVFDVGRVIDETGTLGQIYGGLTQGLGYALFEEMKTDKNGYCTDSLASYILPTSLEIPEMYIELLDGNAKKPKGAGELPLNLVAPAVAAGVQNALDLYFEKLPINPEDLVSSINRSKQIG